jgi:hypothetical protein
MSISKKKQKDRSKKRKDNRKKKTEGKKELDEEEDKQVLALEGLEEEDEPEAALIEEECLCLENPQAEHLFVGEEEIFCLKCGQFSALPSLPPSPPSGNLVGKIWRTVGRR